MNLIIGESYLVQCYGMHPRKVDTIYTGKLQDKSPTQNEVHGFKGINGVYAVKKDDIEKRVSLKLNKADENLTP